MSYEDDSCGLMCVNLARSMFHVVAATCYQGMGRGCLKCDQGGSPADEKSTFEDPGTLMFLWASALWLSGVNLIPKYLCLKPAFKYIYDLFAILVLTNFLLNYLWMEILTCLKIIEAVACEFFFEIDLNRLIKYITDLDTNISTGDVVGFLILAWVLHGAGVFQTTVDVMKRTLIELQCATIESPVSRRTTLRSATTSNYRRRANRW